MVFSIIQKSQLECALRFDAEYYQPEYLELANTFSSLKSKLFSEIAIIRSGTTPIERNDEQGEGVILLKTTNIRNNILAEEKGYYYISREIDNKMKQTKLSSRDVLINIVGATLGVIGRTAFVQSNFPEANITQAMAFIRSKDANFLPEYIFIFLTSRFGRSQADRIARPTGQYNLNLEEVGSFKIPSIKMETQQEIKNIVDNLIGYLHESQKMYLAAENLLLNELELMGFDNEEKLSSIINLSDAKSVCRIDAEYFQEKYKKLVKKIKLSNAKKLGDLVSIKKGFEPGSEEYYEEGKLFIRVSSLSINGIENSDQKYLSEKLYQKLKDDYEPEVGEILLTKDATPGIAYAVKEPVEGIMSGGILRLKLNPSASSGQGNIDAEYLTLCLNSIIGQMQAERDAGGSVIAHWRPEQVKNIMIPVLPKEIQQKIADLVRQSHEARIKAKELLEEAKKKVEEMIEKGGNK